MLVLTLKIGDEIYLGDNITVRFTNMKGRQIKLAIDAPKDTKIDREKAVPWHESDQRRHVYSPEDEE